MVAAISARAANEGVGKFYRKQHKKKKYFSIIPYEARACPLLLYSHQVTLGKYFTVVL